MSSARITYVLFDTSIGRIGLAWKGAMVLAIQLPDATEAMTVERLVARAEGGEPGQTPPRIGAAVERIQRHLAGERVDLSRIPLAMDDFAPFRRATYEAARAVKRGHVLTYGELAASMGRPGAARAVGGAMASNPFAVVVPCHRIVAAGGKPGGYSSYRGLELKAQLLAIEGRALRPEDANSLRHGETSRIRHRW